MHHDLRFLCALVLAVSAAALGGCAKKHRKHLVVDAGAPDSVVTEEDGGPTERPEPDGGTEAPDGGTEAPDGGTEAPDSSPATPDTGAAPTSMEPASGPVTIASVATPCDPPASPPPAPDPSCREQPLHTPQCYRTPVECPAIHESVSCLSKLEDGRFYLFGLDTGASCIIGPPESIGLAAHSFAQVGPDLILALGDVLMKVAIVDGSYDVAPLQAWAVVAVGDSLIVHREGGAFVRYPSWQAIVEGVEGETVVPIGPGDQTVLGGGRQTLVAAHSDRGLTLYNLSDGTQRTLELQATSANPGNDERITGVDISEDGRLFVATQGFLSTYSAESGQLQSRWRVSAPVPSVGLSCQPGLPNNAAPAKQATAARPGFAANGANDASYILAADRCESPYTTPRYVSGGVGPELLVLGSSSGEPSAIRDDRSTPHVLVLSSMEATRWDLTVSAGAGLERVIVNGAASELALHSAVTIPVEYHVDDEVLGSGRADWPSSEQALLRAALERHTGRKITEIYGCHTGGGTFVIRDVPPACPAK